MTRVFREDGGCDLSRRGRVLGEEEGGKGLGQVEEVRERRVKEGS